MAPTPSKATTGKEIAAEFVNIVSKRSGGGGILALSKNFKIIDKDGGGTLDKAEFQLAMKKFQSGFSPAQCDTLFDHYDKEGGSGDGRLSFDEFLKGLRGQMNDARREIAEQAFAAMDLDGSGTLDIDDVKGKYDTSNHAGVISGEITHEEACTEFLMAFEGDQGENTGDGKINLEEWMDYHAGLSSNIDEDDAWGMLMAANWGIEYVPQKEIEEIYAIIREKSNASGDGKKSAMKAFKYFDTDGSGNIDMPEFTQAMKTFHATLTDKQIITMFGTFDQDNSGSVDFAEMLDVVFGDKGPSI
jgi:Ca2+-binding EF-hand superfamily protein